LRERHVHVLHREQALPLAKEELFPFFCDARNLARITPPELGFRFEVLPAEMRVGAEIAYRLRLWGVPFRWRTRVTAWDPPHGFVDEEISGPFAVWRHSHAFRAAPDGAGTTMDDLVEYALPLAPIGEVAHFLVRRQLERIFDYRREVVEELFGGMRSLRSPSRPA
jgi:ligand-binding SRPBCC domain-containing protein